MEAAIIALLFTVLIVVLVLGYVMYKLSKTATIADLNQVVDDVNSLGETVSGAIGRTVEEVASNKSKTENLNDLYDRLLDEQNTQKTDIASLKLSKASQSNLIMQNSQNLLTLSSNINGYVRTNNLDTALADLNYMKIGDSVEFGTGASLKIDGSQLKFCESDDSCLTVSTQIEST